MYTLCTLTHVCLHLFSSESFDLAARQRDGNAVLWCDTGQPQQLFRQCHAWVRLHAHLWSAGLPGEAAGVSRSKVRLVYMCMYIRTQSATPWCQQAHIRMYMYTVLVQTHVLVSFPFRVLINLSKTGDRNETTCALVAVNMTCIIVISEL